MMKEPKIMEPFRGPQRTFRRPIHLVVSTRLLAFLLIITEIFILFNLAVVVYGIQAEDGSNHWPPPPPLSSPSTACNQNNSNHQQDNIKEFPRYNDDQKQTIRAGGIEIATYTAKTVPNIGQQRSHSPISTSGGHHQAGSPLFRPPSLSSPDEDGEPPPPPTTGPNKTGSRLDRHHHSSGANIQLAADVNAASGGISGREVEQPVVAAMREESKSNPLIERHTRRTKRALDDNEAALASIAAPDLPLDDPEDGAEAEAEAQAGDRDDDDVDAKYDLVHWGHPRDTSTLNHLSGDDDEGDNEEMDKQVNELPKLLSSDYRVHHLFEESQRPPRARNHHHHNHHKHHPLGRAKNIRPHSHSRGENHASYVGRLGGSSRNKNALCHRECGHARGGSSNTANNGTINGWQEAVANDENGDDDDSYGVCGSDGRLYGSMCELRVQSCRQNIHLFRRPKAFCLKRQQQQQQQQDSLNQTTRPLTSNHHHHVNHRNGSEKVRIVELKRRCNLVAFNEMKSLLISEFNGDVSSMFNYFDTNGDNYIEAHELWPRQDDRSNKLRYAQLWDEHSSKCRRSGNRQNRGHFLSSYTTRPNHPSGRPRVEQEDPTKCWFFLDFVFEPQFPANPCSLSHLMLFDLRHPNNRFNLESFNRAFEEPRASWATRERNRIGAATNSSTHDDDDGGGKYTPLVRRTRVQIMLGESITLGCLMNMTNSRVFEENLIEGGGLADDGIRCLWTRYNLNLGALQDPHVQLEKRSRLIQVAGSSNTKSFNDLTLELKDAQLYLSGHYKCACYSKKIERTFEHSYSVQVSAEPRVNVRPQFQWSLPGSRISFECHYDYIDTKDDMDDDKSPPSSDGRQSDGSGGRYGGNEPPNDNVAPGQLDEKRGQFGLRVEWLRDNRELVGDGLNQSRTRRQLSGRQSSSSGDNNGTTKTIVSSGSDDDDDPFYSPTADKDGGESSRKTSPGDNNDDSLNNNRDQEVQLKSPSYSFRRASITMAASRLTLENLTLGDSGRHTCRVGVATNNRQQRLHSTTSNNTNNNDNPQREFEIFGQSDGTLLVQEQPKTDQSGALDETCRTYLWMFHDNGISLYRLQNDDGQEMELVREINGHSLVSGEVEGNWNQLTLCGGLNPEQVVICEWSDNALHIDVKHGLNSKTRKYIYVGQPNLNRIIVIDGLKFEIVAIINTEPQPRKLYLYKPSKIHLSKWVRRRLSPAANARWLAAIGTHAHSLKSSPEAKLYSNPRATNKNLSRQQRHITTSLSDEQHQRSPFARPSPLIQHDIWLLCYGQPLVVDPSGDEPLEEASSSSSGRFYPTFGGEQLSGSSNGGSNTTASSNDHKLGQRSSLNSVQPFTPRLTAGAPFGWPTIWTNKESKLRNRKSVHIIQSTFFPLSTLTDDSLHNHDNDDVDNDASSDGLEVERGGGNLHTRTRNETVVGEFKRSTVLTTHHVFSGMSASLSEHKPQLYLVRPQFDLIQDLYVPPKPYSLESNDRHKTHYAYVTHYNDRKLFRVSMDEYRYDRETDLQNCDPINLVTTAQGLLVVQCRAPIAHNLIGQMVLDQLTSSRIEFNANVKAQESYLSPDHRYLVSIFNNSTLSSSSLPRTTTTTTTPTPLAPNVAHDNLMSSTQASSHGSDAPSRWDRSSASKADGSSGAKRQSIIYVQTVSVAGLRLQYEIKTALEISQCSFVWKDGYYAAIFVSTNRRDDQSEILSLRLADSRLQLMARVPGLISVARHKDQLIVSPELRLAALSTNQGSYVVDLEDNRVSQSLRHHQSPPTLLWV